MAQLHNTTKFGVTFYAKDCVPEQGKLAAGEKVDIVVDESKSSTIMIGSNVLSKGVRFEKVGKNDKIVLSFGQMKWYEKWFYTLVLLPVITGIAMIPVSPLIMNPLCKTEYDITVNGIVVDAATRRGLAQASVIPLGLGIPAVKTDNEGYFQFSYKSTKNRTSKKLSFLCQECSDSEQEVINAQIEYQGHELDYEFEIEDVSVSPTSANNHIILDTKSE